MSFPNEAEKNFGISEILFHQILIKSAEKSTGFKLLLLWHVLILSKKILLSNIENFWKFMDVP